MTAEPRDVPAEHPPCEHHWISSHQPDFPDAVYWIATCSLCGDINGARLAEEVEPLEARLAAADRENADLRGEVERLRKKHAERIAVYVPLVDAAEREAESNGAALVRIAAERDDLRAQLAAAERDRDQARSERDDAGLLWGRHYNDAMGALETQLAAAQAQLAEAQREAQEDSRVMLESAKATIALIKQRAELEARLEAVRSYLAMARATESTDHAAGWNLALTAVGNRIAALSAAPQPEPDLSERYFDTLLATTDDPAEKARIEEQRQKHRAQAEPPASDEPTGRSD